jgi:hypothetical protein
MYSGKIAVPPGGGGIVRLMIIINETIFFKNLKWTYFQRFHPSIKIAIFYIHGEIDIHRNIKTPGFSDHL